MTLVAATLEYEGVQYYIEREYDTGYADYEDIEYTWTEGNFGCDCNRSQFLQENGYDFPTLNCGLKIELLDLAIEDADGSIYERHFPKRRRE